MHKQLKRITLFARKLDGNILCPNSIAQPNVLMCVLVSRPWSVSRANYVSYRILILNLICFKTSSTRSHNKHCCADLGGHPLCYSPRLPGPKRTLKRAGNGKLGGLLQEKNSDWTSPEKKFEDPSLGNFFLEVPTPFMLLTLHRRSRIQPHDQCTSEGKWLRGGSESSVLPIKGNSSHMGLGANGWSVF